VDFELTSDGLNVDLWSNVRLPFEPKGEVRAMRDALRVELRRLGGGSITAWLCGPAGSGFDIENVLFYNVGCSAFTGCARRRLRFERRREPSIAPSGNSWTWHHHYTTADVRSAWRYRFEGVELRLGGRGPLPATAAAFWAATQRADTVRAEQPSLTSPLLLRLGLRSARQPNLTEIVKRTTDGVCSALHSYSGSAAEEVALRAASATAVSVALAQEWLQRPGPLGPRTFVWPFGANLQWSPNDDRLVAVELSWEHSAAEDWSLDVGLHEAELDPAL